MLYVGLSQSQATVWMFTVMIMNVANQNDSLMYFHWAGQWRVSFPWFFPFFHQHSLKTNSWVHELFRSLCNSISSLCFSFLPMPMMLPGSPRLEGDRDREAVRLSLTSGRSLYLSHTFWTVEPPKEVKDEHSSPIGSSPLGKRHIAVVGKHYQTVFLLVSVI